MRWILLFLIVLAACTPVQKEDKINGTYCQPDQREADVCIALYKPVCGWFNEDIKCIKYPCAQTFGNSCESCKDEKVIYYTEGECPNAA